MTDRMVGIQLDDHHILRPPRTPSLVAWAALLGAIALQVLVPAVGHTLWHLAGWVLGGVVTITCLAWYRLVDQRRRLDPGYSRGPSSGRLLLVAVVAGSVVGLYHAFRVAEWMYWRFLA